MSSRNHFVDNLRIYLTILVIFHHAALAYGGTGDWPVRDPVSDEITGIFLSAFNALNQSYFMSAFFLLAGYFSPASLERKGMLIFTKERFIRLGIPILFYTILIINFNHYILNVFYINTEFHWKFSYDPGHLWFLQALLFFSLIYIVVQWVKNRFQSSDLKQPLQRAFPSNNSIILCIITLAISTFLVRTIFPVGVWIDPKIQPGHFVHYAFCFYIGIVAYHHQWLDKINKTQAQRWGICSVIVFPFLFVIGILGGLFDNFDQFVQTLSGGWHWQSFAYSIWESILLIGIIIFLLYFFREKLNRTGTISLTLAANVYAIYILHQTILYCFQIWLIDFELPGIVKFFISGALTLIVAAIFSIAIRKIPYVKRVL